MRSGFILALLMIVFGLAGTSAAQAQLPYVSPQNTVGPAPANSACDPEYYETLKSRAWLEAQREITQNQNLIFKPDSVLEYTCFDQHVGVTENLILPIFSRTTEFGTTPSTAPFGDPILNPARNFLSNNFGAGTVPPLGMYPLLGGRARDPNGIFPSSFQGGSGSYTCAIMNQVWMRAKCMGFIDDAENDGFYTFASYAADPEKRFLPQRCGADTRWPTEIGNVFNPTITPWTEDTVQTFLNQTDYEQCASATPVPTGLTVLSLALGSTQTGPSGPYEEKVCIPPGCHYDSGNDRCVPNP